MSRSVYSVVLDDDVVAALDIAAMRAGTNRSAMMNRLLAAQLGFATPEERIRKVFDAMEQLAATQYTALQVLGRDAQAQFSMRSALRYKYNPTVRYSVELYPHSQEYLGVLRAQLRTQNTVLTQALESFYRLWAALEQNALQTPATLYEIGGARFSRVMRLPTDGCSEQQLADRLTRYVSLLDACMKLYCEHLEDPEAAAMLAARHWQANLDAGLVQM